MTMLFLLHVLSIIYVLENDKNKCQIEFLLKLICVGNDILLLFNSLVIYSTINGNLSVGKNAQLYFDFLRESLCILHMEEKCSKYLNNMLGYL